MSGLYGVVSTGLTLALDIGKTYMDYKSKVDSAKAMEKAADAQAALTALNIRAQQAESAEAERRMTDSQDRTMALARAKAAASGTALTGTTADYLGALNAENLQQLDWLHKSGQSQTQITQATGALQVQSTRNTAKSLESEALGSAFSGAGSAYKIGADAGGWKGDTAWYKGN